MKTARPPVQCVCLNPRLSLAAVLLAVILTAACSKKEKESDAKWLDNLGNKAATVVGDPFLMKLKASRKDLAEFYLGTFANLLKGDYYKKETPLTKHDHYAHRLWVSDRDPTFDESIKNLMTVVNVAEVEVRNAKGQSRRAQAAFFSNTYQLHRDQYTMIMSEVGFIEIGQIKISDFILASQADYAANVVSQRPDHPWTVTLLSMHMPHTETWYNARGRELRVSRVIDDMLKTSMPPQFRNEFSCYDYHALYALAAAVKAGYTDYAGAARERLLAAFDNTEKTCATSQGRGDEIHEIVGRLKLNGHLIEAFFRAEDSLFPMETHRPRIEKAVDQMTADIARLRAFKIYEGAPDVMVSLPHAVHGFDLAIRRIELAAPPPVASAK